MKRMGMQAESRSNNASVKMFGTLMVILLAGSGLAGAQRWAPAPTFPGSGAGTAILRTDGIVMVQELTSPASTGGTATGNWWGLVPDDTGNYQTGTWAIYTSTTSFGYAPLYFGSAVLKNGNIAVVGGEYNFGVNVDTTLGYLYNPTKNTWKAIPPPSGWLKMGDAPTVILPNGNFMVGDCCSTFEAILNPTTLTWTSTGTGKADNNSEEGWTLLPNGKVLTIDTQNGAESELYSPGTGSWALAGNLPYGLAYDCANPGIVPELGPAVLRPDGTVLAVGANGYTDIYTVSTKKWTKGPIFPPNSGGKGENGDADGPAALLPNGHVLVMASNINPCNIPPSDFFEFNGTTLNPVVKPPNASNEVSFDGRMLVLPSGHILFTDGTTDVEIYIPAGFPKSAWAPTITTWPNTITGGKSYTIKGTQFNGLSQGAAYGDDAQAATNFPLVRINDRLGHVHFAFTKNFSTMAVATGPKTVSATFIPPKGMATGAATLEVIANGIPSAPVDITVF
jgi:hypothetical protein